MSRPSATAIPFLDSVVEANPYHRYEGHYDKEDNVLVVDNGEGGGGEQASQTVVNAAPPPFQVLTVSGWAGTRTRALS